MIIMGVMKYLDMERILQCNLYFQGLKTELIFLTVSLKSRGWENILFHEKVDKRVLLITI